jgi:hypothetical protein
LTDSVNQSEIESIDSLLLDISMLRAATDNFAESNRLGEGGFGTVYKVMTLIPFHFIVFWVSKTECPHICRVSFLTTKKLQ